MPASLPVPPEPSELRAARGAGWQVGSSEENASRLARLLWQAWKQGLSANGVDRRRFGRLVMAYRSELWLWRVGERPWAHAVSGLIGRIERRLPAPETEPDKVATKERASDGSTARRGSRPAPTGPRRARQPGRRTA